METDTRRQAEKIVEQALGLPIAERPKFIAEACVGDNLLQSEVETLLDLSGGFGEKSVGEGKKTGRRRAASIAPGRKIRHYQIKEKIGAGGMGEVFLADDTKLGRPAAIKVLSEKFARDREGISRFIQEARVISALNHPNILTIYEIGQTGGRHYIVSEFISGETLRERIGREPLPLTEVLEIAAQIARALAAAHAAGIVHRDIKPENIMLRRDRLVKILDFGLAKLTERPNSSDQTETMKMNLVETNPGVLMGTIRYLSPEQARGRDVDGRSDIFSFGIVLYEMIARRLPFAGEGVMDVWAAILNQEPASIRGLMPQLPVEIEEIINKALRKDRRERYQSAEELLADLINLHKRLEIEAETRRDTSPDRKILTVENQTEVMEAPLSFSSSAPSTNLSENFTPIVGREQEIAAVKDLLLQTGVRLLTLTGIGGTGKTTLAKATARELLPDFADGVFFIELSDINDPELVASSIAQPLGVKEAGGRLLLESLKEYLSGRRMLLVLDNFEQLAGAAPQIAELLAAAPRLKILVTSRALLRLSMEREFVVPPLALPAPEIQISPEDLAEYEAIKLFVERARNAKPNFALTEENAQSVAEICARLDGLPLAIELAAARVKILSPRAILSKLENRLQLLTGGAQDLPARQQTMRGAVEWSYELLNEGEKCLFRRLAVFAGGFSLEAAESVVGGETEIERRAQDAEKEVKFSNLDLEIHENQSSASYARLTRVLRASQFDVLDGITSLVDKSLLVAKEQPDGETRFRMLEVVREYALEVLEASGEAEAMRRRHAEYFLAFAEEAEPHLQVSQSAEWLNRLEDEHDNLRAALRWTLDNDTRMAVRLAVAARRFWFLHSYLTEGHGWLKSVLERGGDEASAAERFDLLDALGTLARFEGDYETARRAYEKALAESKAAADLRQIAESSSGLGLVVYQQGDLAAARKFIEEGLAISREMDDKFNIAASLNSLGDIARTEGDLQAARAFFEESLAISRELKQKQFVGTILTNLGAVTYEEGDFESARAHFAEALKMARELGNRVAISYSLDGFAALAVSRGETETAARLAAAAERLRESLGLEIEPADARFRESYLEKLRAALPQPEFAVAYGQGRKMKLKESVALALTLA